jgi:hypothetical protein
LLILLLGELDIDADNDLLGELLMEDECDGDDMLVVQSV